MLNNFYEIVSNVHFFLQNKSQWLAFSKWSVSVRKKKKASRSCVFVSSVAFQKPFFVYQLTMKGHNVKDDIWPSPR